MLTRRSVLNALTLGATAMSIRSDDLTDLFTTKPDGLAIPMRYRSGIIQTWNPITLENTVQVGQSLLTNLPVLGVSEAASFAPGVVVGIAVVESTWAIIGRFVIPATDDAEDAITQIGQRTYSSTILTAETTTSSPFVDLTTPGPTVSNVRIPASGKAFVTVSAQFQAVTGSLCVGTVGVAVSGTDTRAADTKQSLILIASNAGINASRTLIFNGLTPGGINTFTLKYGSNGSVNMEFSNRDITVELK